MPKSSQLLSTRSSGDILPATWTCEEEWHRKGGQEMCSLGRDHRSVLVLSNSSKQQRKQLSLICSQGSALMRALLTFANDKAAFISRHSVGDFLHTSRSPNAPVPPAAASPSGHSEASKTITFLQGRKRAYINAWKSIRMSSLKPPRSIIITAARTHRVGACCVNTGAFR